MIYTAWAYIDQKSNKRISPVNGFMITGYRVRIGTDYKTLEDAQEACREWLKEQYGDVELDYDDGSQFHHPHSGNSQLNNDAFVCSYDPCPGVDRI